MRFEANDLLASATAFPAPARSFLPAVLVYAHPDDEAIAVGGRLSRFAESLFIQVTDGAPADNEDGRRLGLSREEYRNVRLKEKQVAFQSGGLPAPRELCFGVTDKETVHCLVEITRRLLTVLKAERPEVVFTHPYERGHSDHDSCAFAVHTAVTILKWESAPAPMIVECPFYFLTEEREASFGEKFLFSTSREPLTYFLSAEERGRKDAVFAAYQSQKEILKKFQTEREMYRMAPPYDFTEPPLGLSRDGTCFIGARTGDFCDAAGRALRELPPGAAVR